MKKNRLYFLVALILVASLLFSACAQSGTTDKPAATDKTNSSGASDPSKKPDDKAPSEEGDLEPYTYTHYYNYDWWNLKEWGKDEVSKFLQAKFNINIEFSKPDTDPQAKLNTMIAADDLPDSIMMDRNADYLRMIELGLLQPLEPFMANNPNYDQNLDESTKEMLKVDGKLYVIPQWSRTKPTGGNLAWMVVDSIYKEMGSPKLLVWNDLYEYAKKIKAEVPTTKEGLSVTPVQFAEGGDGAVLTDAFYRSMGGMRSGWYTVLDGKLQFIARDSLFKDAVMEMNKWWREGLISETQFTDNGDAVLEKIVAGRNGLLFYDQSKDSTNKFRKIYKEKYNDTYEMILPNLFPPYEGLAPDDIYGEWGSTTGGSGIVITNKAKEPQRIFDLRSYFLTPEAACILMYGPQGEWWDEKDANGLPLLKKPESELTTDEINRLGTWFWMEPGHADNIDSLKYAVNAALPVEKQDWVIFNQANYQTPVKWITNEFVGLTDSIKPTDPAGVTKTLIEDYLKAQLPQAIMADSEAQASEMFDDILKFAVDNDIESVEKIMDERYQQNVAKVGTKLTRGRYAK